jgi:FG-GAP-like repeat
MGMKVTAAVAKGIALAGASTLFLAQMGCGPGDDCSVTATCTTDTGGGGTGAAGGAGGTGGNPGGGGTGGTGGNVGGGGGLPDTCNDNVADPGEICFPEMATIIAVAGQTTTDLELYDCDDDSDLDILTANQSSGDISVLRNDGAGVFTVSSHALERGAHSLGVGTFYPIPGQRFVSQAGTTLDVYTFLADCVPIRGTGDTNPSPGAGQNNLPSAGSAVLMHDANGFLSEDIVAAAGSQFIMRADGNLSTTYTASHFAGAVSFMAVGEINSDGTEDVVYVDSGANQVRWAFGGQPYDTNTNNAATVGLNPFGAAVGQLDDDLFADIVVANRDGDSLSILINNGAAAFTKDTDLAVPAPVGASRPSGVAIADFDNDGDNDIASVNAGFGAGFSTVSIFVNDGMGSFALHGVEYQVERQSERIMAADMNGDSVPDIVLSSPYVDNVESNVSVLLSTP